MGVGTEGSGGGDCIPGRALSWDRGGGEAGGERRPMTVWTGGGEIQWRISCVGLKTRLRLLGGKLLVKR